MGSIMLYHGSAGVIEKPDFDFSNPNNDFGRGFYCTESIELAREWAVVDGRDGYVNTYALETDVLRVLDLGAKEYSILHWAALVSANRELYEDGADMPAVREYLAARFSLDTEGYDIIKGYPADDCCLMFLMDFMVNRLPVQGLAKALGIDGREQTVIKSDEAFSRLHFAESGGVSANKHYHNRKMRCGVVNRRYDREVLACAAWMTSPLRSLWPV